MTEEHPPRVCAECGDDATARLLRDGDAVGLRCDECLADELGVDEAR
jgi:hypothetical protein